MILQFNYEELRALKQGAATVLRLEGSAERCPVAAPPAERARVEALVPQLDGDLSISTLDEQERVEEAVCTIVECLHSEMDAAVLAAHPADEGAVAAYFDYAHAITVLERVQEMGDHMRALIEIVTGDQADPAVASSFTFPD